MQKRMQVRLQMLNHMSMLDIGIATQVMAQRHKHLSLLSQQSRAALRNNNIM